MDLGVFYEVIVPLLEVKDTALICISTPLDSWNFYSQLTEVRDEKGRRLFNVRHVQKGARPAWKPDEGLSKMRAIYGKARKAMLETEIYGMIARATGSAFNRRLLTDFFDAAPCEEPHPINDNCIYVSVDPNGGAKASNASGSDTAIVSFFFSRGRVVVSDTARRRRRGWGFIRSRRARPASTPAGTRGSRRRTRAQTCQATRTGRRCRPAGAKSAP